MADCGTKPCKNTCHKIVNHWNAPNSIFADFQNDVLGKCDICFRAGYCSLTECDSIKAEEIRIVNELVENGLYRGKVNKENGKKAVTSVFKIVSPGSVPKLATLVKRSLRESIRAKNAELAAKQIGSVVNDVVNQAASKQNDRIVKRNVVYKNFVLQANIICVANDKFIFEIKVLF
jgi:hypothetical protein